MCEFCSEEYIRRPTTRVQKIIEDPAIFNDWDHWANMLNTSLFKSNKQWILDLNQIIDVHRKEKVQWRRNNFSLKQISKHSWGPEEYVMDSQPFHQYVLTQEQEREHIRVADNKPLEISWSCAGIAPDDFEPQV